MPIFVSCPFFKMLRLRSVVCSLLSVVCCLLSVVCSPAWAGEYDAEIAKEKQIVSQNSANLDAAYQLANHLAWDARYEEALKVYEDILDTDPKYIDADIGIARIYSWMGDQEKAVQKYQEILARAPNNFEAYQGLGLLALWNSDFENSVDYFDKALKINPEDVISLKGIGRAYFGKGDRRRADDYFARAEMIELRGAHLKSVLGIAGAVVFTATGLFFWIRFGTRRRKTATTKLELKLIRTAVDLYLQLNGKYPLALEYLLREKHSVHGKTGEKPYLEDMRLDERGFIMDAFGEKYWYNANTGNVRSSKKGCEDL